MRTYLAFLFCLITSFVYGQKPFYYYNEELQYDNAPNEVMPRLKIPHEKVIQKLKEVVSYPRFAKSKFISQEVNVKLTLNDSGRVTQYLIEDPGFLMFDTLAIRIAKQLENDWLPAKVNGKATSYQLTIPFDFSTKLIPDSHKIYFVTKVFTSKAFFTTESSTSFPASVCFKDSILMKDSISNKFIKKRTDQYIIKEIEKQVPSMSSFVGMYGTVRLGFNVDKTGKLSNIQIVHPMSKTMDDRALEDIKAIQNDWMPAYEDGQPIDSYKEFDFRYTIEVGAPSNEYHIYLTHRTHLSDLISAYSFLEKEKYEKALEKFKTVERLLLDDIDIKYRIGMIEIFLGNVPVGCKKLDLIKSIAIDTGYPASVTESMVDEAISKYCTSE